MQPSVHESPDPGTPAPPSAEPQPQRTARRRRRWPWLLAAAAGAYVLVTVGLVVWWCNQPPVFDVAAQTQASSGAAGAEAVPGSAVVGATIGIAETLLEKPGGFIYNDRLPPGLFLDNCPSWECGVLMALRDAVQALRNDFTRAQTQSAENLDVKRADLKLAIDPTSWMLPAAEDEYRQALEALRAYSAALGSGELANGGFFARADNLSAYLALVEKRLGNFGVRLSGSIADPGLSAMVSADPGGQAAQAIARTAPDEVDNVFYCARGYSWAFLHMMRAIAIDFGPVLADKNAEATIQQIDRDLQGAIKPMISPVVLNGHGYGFLANHSLVIASYVSRVNAAVIDLRLLLDQG
jgi:hypothetical protein